jgi:fatty-acyl-CoA synthase
MLIGDWLARRADLTPHKVALLDAADGLQPITFRQWNANVSRTARFLAGRFGVQRGDRVAVLAMNCVAYLDIWFACGKLGAILQNLNWRLTPVELAGLIADAEPTLLIYGPEFVDQVRALRSAVRGVALDAARRADPNDAAFDERDAFADNPFPAVDLMADDPWVICYTGGTTGLPKGAILTHGNIFFNAVNTVAGWGLRPDDVTILNAPLFHTGGLNVFTAPLAHIGGTSIVCRQFDPDQVFDLIERQGVTIYFGVPTMFLALQRHPRWETADFSRVRWMISGGAPCPPPVFETFRRRGVPFRTGYGLTEAGPNTFWLPDEDIERKAGAVGYPLPHIDLRLVNERGNLCAAGEVGELHIRGAHVCAGYWRRPVETAATIVDGWLRTGDLARRDEEGCYTIVGRLKDVIISGGENIYPAEVEAVLAGHPAVAEVALIGAPDPTWVEVGWAVVVLHEAFRQSAQDIERQLIDYCRDRLARYKIPKRVIVVDALPRTGAGKIDKRALRAMLHVEG